jgi:hypothetical protein
MSQNNPIRLFITHAWDTSDDYLRIFEYRERPKLLLQEPVCARQGAGGGKDADREELRRQMAQAECVIALPGLYAKTATVSIRAHFRQGVGQAVISCGPSGERRAAEEITSLSDQIVDWDGRALVDSVKAQARHEESNRWDTIEFKLD